MLAKYGVDPGQLFALTRALVKCDLRRTVSSPTSRTANTGSRNFYFLLVFYLLLGLSLIPLIVNQQNLFAINFLLLSYSMFVVGSQILIEYHGIIISPEDHRVIGPLPVSSRTFFLAKLINLLIYILTFTAVIAMPAVIAILVYYGTRFGVATCLAVFLSNLSTALLVVMLYAFLMTRINAKKLQAFLSGFQIVFGFMVYGAFFALSYLLDSSLMQTIKSAQWAYAFPQGWFSSYVLLAAGETESTNLVLTVVSLFWTGSLLYLVAGKLSSTYAEGLEVLAAGPEKSHRPPAAKSWFVTRPGGSFEARAVSHLIVQQFRHDNKFKMSVLAILPLTFFYFLLGTQEGPLSNPFIDPYFEMGRSGLLYMLVFLFPMMLRTQVTHSDAYQAAWIFYSTPASLDRLVVAQKNFLMRFFVIPFLLLLGMIFFFHFEHLAHVVLHILVLGLLSHLFLQLAFMLAPDLPFSRPHVKGQQSRRLIVVVLVILVTLYTGFPLMFRYFYAELSAFLIFFVSLGILNIAVEALLHARIGRVLRRAEFAD